MQKKGASDDGIASLEGKNRGKIDEMRNVKWTAQEGFYKKRGKNAALQRLYKPQEEDFTKSRYTENCS